MYEFPRPVSPEQLAVLREMTAGMAPKVLRQFVFAVTARSAQAIPELNYIQACALITGLARRDPGDVAVNGPLAGTVRNLLEAQGYETRTAANQRGFMTQDHDSAGR